MNSEQQTILVVDDNPVNLSILSDCLSRAGFTVLLKKDGEKALALTDRKKPDIILLDILMPVMDGFETCRRLKEREDTKEIPVIFMTALSETEDKVRGFELGAVDYITKPFQQEEVLARVKTHITVQRLKNDLRIQNQKLSDALEREKRIIEDLRLNLSLSLPHELRTPLNSILGFSELLKNAKYADPEKMSSYGSAIFESGRHLHRLVENALLYANLKLLKFASDKSKTWQRDCSMKTKALIMSIAGKCAADAERSSEDIVFDLTDADIMVSSKNFDKILTEIIGNALKFSLPGAQVQIRSSINGNLFLLSISDKGRGMTRQQVDQIGAFMQFDRRLYEQQGSGLGLIISCLLVQLEGGMISIESHENQGTTVSMVFHRNTQTADAPVSEAPCWFDPADVDALIHNKESASDAPAVGGYLPLQSFFRDNQKDINCQIKYKILVVSDNMTNRTFVSQLLTGIGFEVIETPDVNLGLHKAIESKPHVLLIDMDMLDQDDTEDIQKMRTSPGFGMLKIIAMTGKTLDSVNTTGLTQWADDVLFAPVSRKDIFDSLKTNLLLKWI